MLQKEIVNYRNLIVLKDGTKVLLRALTQDDQDDLIKMFSNAHERDVRFLRDDVKDRAVIETWIEELDFSKVLPLLAIVQNQLIGLASLHFRTGPERHIGEVRIFLTRDYRRRSLGTRMLQTLIDLARRYGLFLVEAEVVASHIKVVKAFENLGFKKCCTFDDYFMLPDGETQDIVRLILKLKPSSDEF